MPGHGQCRRQRPWPSITKFFCYFLFTKSSLALPVGDLRKRPGDHVARHGPEFISVEVLWLHPGEFGHIIAGGGLAGYVTAAEIENGVMELDASGAVAMDRIDMGDEGEGAEKDAG